MTNERKAAAKARAVDLFRSLDVTTAIDLLLVTPKRTYKAAAVLCNTRNPGAPPRTDQAGPVRTGLHGVHRTRRARHRSARAVVLARTPQRRNQPQGGGGERRETRQQTGQPRD